MERKSLKTQGNEWYLCLRRELRRLKAKVRAAWHRRSSPGTAANPPTTWAGWLRPEARRVRAERDAKAIVARLNDKALADRIAAGCHDPHHDDRWCATCEARADGIDAYRRAVLGDGRP